jgi:hypothetical protein
VIAIEWSAPHATAATGVPPKCAASISVGVSTLVVLPVPSWLGSFCPSQMWGHADC